MVITKIINTIIKVVLKLSSSHYKAIIYRKYYGVNIGKNVRFTGLPTWGSEPYLVEIGDDVTITQNVTFNTHDGGVGIFRREYPGINVFGKIKIGNNVFIGSNTTFLPDVTVGNNVVIATGSIITKDVPDNVVIGGIPAKIIKSIDEYKSDVLKKAIFLNDIKSKDRKNKILSSVY